MKLKTEVKIKSQGSDNKKLQSFGGAWPFTFDALMKSKISI
jgi:hypothetical protein